MPTELKDGLGNEFTIKTKDVSPSQNNSIRQNWHLATRYPIDHASGGAFQTTMKSNVITTGQPANSPIASFRFVSPSLICLLRSLDFSMWNVTTPFSGPNLLSFDAFVARTFTADDTGGLVAALSGNVGKLRTTHQSPLASLRVSNTIALTAGTRVLDAAPFESLLVGLPGTGAINAVYFQNEEFFRERDHPLVLGNQEGVIIQASVPAGTWAFAVTAVWDEIEANNF